MLFLLFLWQVIKLVETMEIRYTGTYHSRPLNYSIKLHVMNYIDIENAKKKVLSLTIVFANRTQTNRSGIKTCV